MSDVAQCCTREGLWYKCMFNLTTKTHEALLPMEVAEGSFDVSETASYDGKLY